MVETTMMQTPGPDPDPPASTLLPRQVHGRNGDDEEEGASPAAAPTRGRPPGSRNEYRQQYATTPQTKRRRPLTPLDLLHTAATAAEACSMHNSTNPSPLAASNAGRSSGQLGRSATGDYSCDSAANGIDSSLLLAVLSHQQELERSQGDQPTSSHQALPRFNADGAAAARSSHLLASPAPGQRLAVQEGGAAQPRTPASVIGTRSQRRRSVTAAKAAAAALLSRDDGDEEGEEGDENGACDMESHEATHMGSASDEPDDSVERLLHLAEAAHQCASMPMEPARRRPPPPPALSKLGQAAGLAPPAAGSQAVADIEALAAADVEMVSESDLRAMSQDELVRHTIEVQQSLMERQTALQAHVRGLQQWHAVLQRSAGRTAQQQHQDVAYKQELH